jgi:hypothetical protein
LSKANSIKSDILTSDVIKRGLEWLLSACNHEGAWGRTAGESSSAVHTSLALMAVVDAGLTRYSTEVVAAREWLLSHLDDRDSIFDNYDVPHRDDTGKIVGAPRRTINHLNFPGGLIVQGLLTAGTNLLDDRLLRSVEDLISLQDKDGSWTSKQVAWKQPVYAIMDAVLALSHFIRQVEDRQVYLELMEQLQTIRNEMQLGVSRSTDFDLRLSGISESNQAVLDRIASIDVSLSELRGSVTKIERLEQHINRIEQGLWLARPFATLSRFCAQFRLFALILFLLVLAGATEIISRQRYGIKSRTFVLSSWTVDGVLLLISILAFFFELYPHARRKGASASSSKD